MTLLLLTTLVTMFVFLPQYADPPPQPVRPVIFEVRLAETSPATGLTAAAVRNEPNTTIYLHPEALLTNADLKSAVPVEVYDRMAIEFSTYPLGAERLRQATAGNIGKYLSILVDGEVRVAARINSEIGERALFDGDFSPSEAEQMAAGMMHR
jgi:preprotein translocase subunit SecD